MPSRANISTVIGLYNRQHVPALFVQDDWKVTHRLTLNLGVRYDYFSPTVEAHNRQSNFDYATGTLITAGSNGASDGLVTVDKSETSRHDSAFAWSPRASANTVVRGALRIFFSGQEIRTAAPLQLAYNLPFFYEPLFIQRIDAGIHLCRRISDARSKPGSRSRCDYGGLALSALLTTKAGTSPCSILCRDPSALKSRMLVRRAHTCRRQGS